MNYTAVVGTLIKTKKQLTNQLQQIEAAINALSPRHYVKRVLSPEARKRISRAQKLRWKHARQQANVLPITRRKAA